MRCEEARPLIDGYLDGELDLERNLDLERHLEACADCAPVRQRAIELRSAIRESVPYFRAPRSLEQRVRANIRPSTRAKRGANVLWWQWLGAAAAVLLVLFAVLRLGTGWRDSTQEQLVAQEVVAGHIRSLMANHLADVASTDQHTVKPWFDGKLDFAPPVKDLAADGFPLRGGRLDYLGGRAVAALAYEHGQHPIDLFVWPERGAQPTPPVTTRHGYNVVQWTADGMALTAVSDLERDELEDFARLWQKAP